MSDELLTACKQVMQRYPDAKIRRRPDDAIEIRSERFVGLVRSHGDVVVGHAQGREHRAQIKGSLEGAVRAVTLQTPLTRESAIGMVAAAIRTRKVEGQSPLAQRFRAWRDRGYHARVGQTEFHAKSSTELAEWLVSRVGRRAAAKATGERVKAAPTPAMQTAIASLRRRLEGLDEALRVGRAALDKLEQDPQRYYPQFKNLISAFKLAYDAGRIGMKLTERLEKDAKE